MRSAAVTLCFIFGSLVFGDDPNTLSQEKQVKAKKSELSGAKKARHKSDKALVKAQGDKESLADQLSGLNADLANEKDQIEKNQKKIKSLEEENKELSQEILKARKEQASLKILSTEYLNQTTKLDSDRATIDEQAAQVRKELAHQQSIFYEKEKSLNLAKDAYSRAAEQLKQAQFQKDKLLESITKAEKERDKSDANRKNAFNESQRIKTENGQLESRSQAADEAKVSKQNEYKATTDEVAKLKEMNRTRQLEVSKKEAEIKDLQGLVDTGKEELEKAKKQKEELRRKNAQVSVERDRLQVQADVLKRQYDTVRNPSSH